MRRKQTTYRLVRLILVLATILGSPSLALASAPSAPHAARAASVVSALALPASSASPALLPSPPASPSFLPTRKKGIQLALLKSLLATAHGREILRRTYGIDVTCALDRTYGSHHATSAM